MNAYKTYMDRQTISPNAHNKLLSLREAPEPKARFEAASHWKQWGALAACAALILGVGTFALQNRPTPIPPMVPQTTPDPTGTPAPTFAPDVSDPDPVEPPEDDGFLIHSPATEERLNFYGMPALNFQEEYSDIAASLALPDGSFFLELTLADLQKLLWGPEGKPEDLNPDTDLPWVLGWDGYTVWMGARYDGNGDLWMVTIHGSKGLNSFELQIAPGRLPPQCLADPDGESVDVNGTAVTSYYRAYDRDGDGLTDHVCTSEFLVDGYGYRFRNAYTETGKEEFDVAEAAKFFNTCFVMRAAQWTDSRCYFGHIAHNDNIPPWEETNFDTLAAARERTEFAPYLPETAPVNWSEFHGHLSYQEGVRNYLFVRWTKMYDNVEICVYLPEDPDGYPQSKEPVDINLPESYDYRLYTLPLCDSVPREYVVDFYSVLFRAEDMSLEAVKARETEHDTGGSSFHFSVRHENGVVVSYSCDRITAEELWALIEPTL